MGAGTVGPGIALTFALAGHQVKMYSRTEDSIIKGFNTIDLALKKFLDNNFIEQSQMREIRERITGVTSLEQASPDTDFVIESVAENLAVKQEVFAKMEQLCPSETIFASSTSGLSPTAIAENLVHKERFVVAHFWNPPHLIPLVEIVPGRYTSEQAIGITYDLLSEAGKKPVVLKQEALGFIGNRLQFAMLREALNLIESGIADMQAVDTTIKYALGRRLATTGPFESADLSGLDIICNISSYLMNDLSCSSEVSPILKQTVAEGKLGAKTGNGFYDWTPESLSRIKKIREEDLIEWLKKDKFNT